VTAAERNHRAVTTGLAKSGPVVAAAASIMILVFGSFMFGGARELAEFGFGLAFSVLVDALLIRSLLVPALMHIIGPVNRERRRRPLSSAVPTWRSATPILRASTFPTRPARPRSGSG
jgi:uncharacterized membrane protein YdfJ with MMPL/SSD domain